MSSQKIPTLMGRLFYPTMTMLLLSFAFTLLPEWSIVRGAEIQDGRKKVDFNRNWKFMKGEQEGGEDIGFDDSAWQSVRLPHDWAIVGPFDPSGNGGTGKLPWQGVGWYRKIFSLDESDVGKRVYFNFDGIMTFPGIYINGHLAGTGEIQAWDAFSGSRIDTAASAMGTDHVQVSISFKPYETRLLVVGRSL